MKHKNYRIDPSSRFAKDGVKLYIQAGNLDRAKPLWDEYSVMNFDSKRSIRNYMCVSNMLSAAGRYEQAAQLYDIKLMDSFKILWPEALTEEGSTMLAQSLMCTHQWEQFGKIADQIDLY